MKGNNLRSRRRHTREVKIKRAQRMYAHMSPEMQDWARRNYNHLRSCSCYLCGHYRKWHGITLQERRSLLALKDQ